jgi:DNA integrity scanning protein DisA with diadenylate cyclase activity/mannitol/fructose-specific phosphotransferase system IIA component (Ntr-type)
MALPEPGTTHLNLIPHGQATLRTVVLPVATKEDAIHRLADYAAEHVPEMAGEEIATLALDREALATSGVADEIAFPHAVRSDIGETVIVLGRCDSGIDWNPAHPAVKLVVLFVGGEENHLAAMGTMARILRSAGVRDAVLDADSPESIAEILGNWHATDPQRSNTAVLRTAVELADSLPNTKPAIVAATFPDGQAPPALWAIFDGYVLGGTSRGETENVPSRGHSIVAPYPFSEVDERSVVSAVSRGVMEGLYAGLSNVVVAFGRAGSGTLESIRLVPIRTESHGVAVPGISREVIQRVEELAGEISREGREGKPVGCFFVIASSEDIQSMTHQLIVNPFLGYPREARNILDPSIEETIKEFSKIDGAFVISPDGTVESAGTYIVANPETLEHRHGEGTRHASARAITAAAPAISVVVSESTGRVSVFAAGRLIA